MKSGHDYFAPPFLRLPRKSGPEFRQGASSPCEDPSCQVFLIGEPRRVKTGQGRLAVAALASPVPGLQKRRSVLPLMDGNDPRRPDVEEKERKKEKKTKSSIVT